MNKAIKKIKEIKDWIWLLKFPAKELRRLVENEMEKEKRKYQDYKEKEINL